MRFRDIKMRSVYRNGDHPRCPALFNLAAYALSFADVTPNKPALLMVNSQHVIETWSFNALRNAVLSTAYGFLKQGLCPKDRILLRLGNTVEFPIAYLAAIAVDLVPVPTSSQLTEREVEAIIATIQPKAILTSSETQCPEQTNAVQITNTELKKMQEEPLADFIYGDPKRLAYIVFTSGTSATPNAVMHAHRAIWARQMMVGDWYQLKSNDRILHAGAFNWTFTLGTGLLDPWSIGATALVPEPNLRLKDIPDLLEKYDVSLFAAAPGIYRKILKNKHILKAPSLRHGLSAGEKLQPSVSKDWRHATGTKIYEAFGMTECSTFISHNPQLNCSEDTIGMPQTGRAVAILPMEGDDQPVELGEIGIISIDINDSGLMLGYLEDQTPDTGNYRGDWFLTGDMGKMDADGAITYLGRNDDMMNAGGFRVSPIEVEAVLLTHPDISSVAVCQIEVKNDVMIIAAFFTAQCELNEDELKIFASTRLARYKQPRAYFQRESLPHGPNGKILRRNLKQLPGPSNDQT
ncbi:MAG: class I adenylate-forming enzyme family protein [Paracoccaceae bacterium]